MRAVSLLIGVAFFAGNLFAQTVEGGRISLSEAVDLALQRNLLYRQAALTRQEAALGAEEASLARYPSLNGRISGGYQFGLNVDPTTNDFTNEAIAFNNLGLDAGWTLWSGGRIRNTLKRARLLSAAAEADALAIQQDLALSVAENYLQILLAQDQAEAARSRLRQAEVQLDQTERMISAGSLAPTELYEPAAQVARQQQTIIQAENTVDLSLLQLRQLLLLDADTDLAVVPPLPGDFESSDLLALTVEQLYQQAASRMAAVEAERLRAEAATMSEEVARSAYFPVLSAFGQLNTRYSSSAQQFMLGDTVVIEQEVFIDGQPFQIGFAQPQQRFQDLQYFEQLRQYFGQAVGLSLSVPIFNNGQARLGVERARLATERQRITLQQAEQNLRLDIARALQAARAAERELAAARSSLEAARVAYEAAQRRQELGAGGAFALTTSQLLLEQAEVEVLRARYQYLFNTKVLDFYLGRPLELE